MVRISTARRKRSEDGVRWHVVTADIRSISRHLVHLISHDWTTMMLVVSNIVPVVDIAIKREPVASILVIYWIQLMILGLWNAAKLVVITRWRSLLVVPLFFVMYLSIVSIFGIMAGALLDDQMRGTDWLQQFSLWNYWGPGLLFFATHGVSFYVNFFRGREFERIKWDQQLGKPILRVMPMWLAAIAGTFVGGLFGSAAVTALCVVPVKTALDVFGHLIEHGKLTLDPVHDSADEE